MIVTTTRTVPLIYIIYYGKIKINLIKCGCLVSIRRIEMLNIYYGKMPEAIYNTSSYFSNTFQKTWLDDPYIRRMIKNVDKSEVIDDYLIKSKALGMIAPSQLSGGVKTLILTYFMPDKIFNASTCGDNCAPWILKIAETRKVEINLRHLMDFGKAEFKIKVVNTGRIVTNMGDLVAEAGEFV